MQFTKLAAAAIAASTVAVSVPFQAEATEVRNCYTTSNRLHFLYEDGLAGYFAFGDTFPCATHNGRTLHTIVNGEVVNFTDGAVDIDGFAFVLDDGILYPVERSAVGGQYW